MSAQHQETSMSQAHIISQLLGQLEESSRRFNRLELDALEIEKLVLTDVQKQKELFKDSTKSSELIHESLQQFENDLEEMKKKVRNISLSFKELIKKESVNELEATIDQWPLEQFITRKEFSLLLENKEE